MINFALFTALATFYFTMFFTPGPNNAMLTASGMKFGFVRTLPHLIGIPLGHILQIGLTCFGLVNLFLIYPQIQFYMRIFCFLYLIYLNMCLSDDFVVSLWIMSTGNSGGYDTIFSFGWHSTNSMVFVVEQDTGIIYTHSKPLDDKVFSNSTYTNDNIVHNYVITRSH